MATFKRCDESVNAMAESLIKEFHPAILDLNVKIDFVFAYGERDEVTLQIKTPALKKNGVEAHGITRKLPLKDRAMGRGDAEIALDGDWWEKASEAERRALLDHELYHIVPSIETDDLHRPKINLRPHDYEFGWFRVIAHRHGIASHERQQAKLMVDESGQYFWPSIEVDTAKATRFASIEVR